MQLIHRNLLIGIHDSLQETFFEKNKYADKVIERLLKAHKKWGSQDRAVVSEIFYNIIRWNTSIAGSILATYTTTNTTYTVPSLGAGTYYFTIEATNAAGTGPRSTPRTTAIVGGTAITPSTVLVSPALLSRPRWLSR